MPIEIEKKYRLTKKQRGELVRRLPQIGAISQGEEFEENTLYSGDPLEVGRCDLSLRRIGDRAILTYKERFPSDAPIKRQREDETGIADGEAMDAILILALSLNRRVRRKTFFVSQDGSITDTA